MATYQIAVSDEKIANLKAKLEHTSFPDELNEAAWDYGAPLADIKRLTEYWRDRFDWRAQEAKLNELPQFHRTIEVSGFDPLDIHYIYQPSDNADAVPLLFCHGWPGSYIEVTKMLKDLQESSNGVSFHVVAPSLPNYGWSEGVKKKGFGIAQYAETCHRLMQSLGFNKYVTQGGDWGFFITRAMGMLYPSHVAASHINMVRANPPKWSLNPWIALQHSFQSYTDEEQRGLERGRWFQREGSGYRTLQGTKPQTLGYALNDSPVALLAWIYEKLHDWTHDYPWTEDEILTWISIYWFSTAGPAANVRIYYEAIHTKTGISRERVSEWIPTVKLGLCYAPRELGNVPMTWGRTMGPVVYESVKTRGGHFAAWEIPEEIVGDLRAMFGKRGPCYQITGAKARL